jgi:hemerythrin-like metal-binding protein
MIDAEHQNLIVAVNSVEHAMGARDRVALSRTFDLLETYMRIHFRNEEKIAEAVNFSFAQNKREHEYFLGEIKSFREELERMNGVWSDDLANRYYAFLTNWMTEHIMTEDMQLKPVLETYPYDFKPG